jgi:hypothetical protein
MTKTSYISRSLSVALALAGIAFAGHLFEAGAQTRDPFIKPAYARPKPQGGPSVRIGRDGKPTTDTWGGIPSIEHRIDYYKRMRAAAAANGSPLPKVTSVLTLSEMSVTGIFRTPRGYAAMVEATPIKLSYTIYPGEKFFDGQLVAVEENQLIFRRVTKTGQNKFVSSVENKPLRKYTDREALQGTAPADPQTASATSAPQSTAEAKPAPTVIVSPLDEMNKQPSVESEKTGKAAKKPAKVARN